MVLGMDFGSNKASGNAMQIFGNQGSINIHNTLEQHSIERRQYEFFRSHPVFLVPFERDDRFISRGDILDAIEKALEARKRAAVAGMGGVGYIFQLNVDTNRARKSQIAIEYCYVLKDRQPDINVFWVQATTQARLTQDFTRFARKFALPGWNDPQKDVLELVSDEISRDKRDWLLVLDSADDADVLFRRASTLSHGGLFKYLPKGEHVSILTTTRDKRLCRKMSKDYAPVLVDVLSEEQAVQMLLSKLPEYEESTDSMRKLAKDMGYLPLAITQAAAFISSYDISVERYLEMYQSSDENITELLFDEQEDTRRDHEASGSVIRTWKLLFDQTRKSSPRAAETLCSMAFLDWHDIPESLLRSTELSEIVLVQSLGILQALSFINRDQSGTSYQMHRLVHLSIQKWLALENLTTLWREKTLKTLAMVFPPGEDDEWPLCERYLPHALYILRYPSSSNSSRLERAELLFNLGSYQNARGKAKEATKFLLETTATREQVLGFDHPLTLESYGLLGSILAFRGKATGAKRILTRAIRSIERSTKNDLAEPVTDECNEPSVASTKKSTSRLLTSLNSDSSSAAVGSVPQPSSSSQAEQTPRLSLRSIIEILNRYGQTLFDLWLMGEAEELVRIMLPFCEKHLGDDDFETLRCMHNLSAILISRKDFAEAEVFARQHLSRLEQSLGLTHYRTLCATFDLGALLVDTSRYADAEPLCRAAIDGLSGLEDAMYPLALIMLSMILNHTDRVEEANEFARKALSHMDLIEDGSNFFVRLYYTLVFETPQWDSPDAEELGRRVWNSRKTAESLPNLNVTIIGYILGYSLCGRKNEQAAEILREVFRDLEKLFGSYHELILMSLKFLAAALMRLDNWEEARSVLDRAYQMALKMISLQYKPGLRSCEDLTTELVQIGKVAEAKDILRRLQQTYAASSGVMDSNAIRARGYMGMLSFDLGRLSEARELVGQAYQDAVRAVGPDHQLAINMAKNMDTIEEAAAKTVEKDQENEAVQTAEARVEAGTYTEGRDEATGRDPGSCSS